MADIGMLSIYFVNKFSSDKRNIPFPVSPTMSMADILPELSKKFSIHMQNISIACQGGQVLTTDDYSLPLKNLIDKFGKSFDIIDRNIVGGGDDDKGDEYTRTIVDELVPEFEEKWAVVSPGHPAWEKRVQNEIKNILRYLNYQKLQGYEPWFKLVPLQNPRYKFMVWKGHILVPSRPEIKFEINVVLNKDYPKSCPRCFAEESITDYCGKLYFGNKWTAEDKTEMIMICHDHMSETEAWHPTLGIAHFFIREVWVWWAAQQNFIIKVWDEKQG